jgi:hypothetical protein
VYGDICELYMGATAAIKLEQLLDAFDLLA